MYEFAIVKNIQDGTVFVVPMISHACLKCTTGCQRQGRPFAVANKRNLAVEEGAVVRLSLSRIQYTYNGIMSLLAPIVCAVAALVRAPALSARFIPRLAETNPELARFAVVLASFLLSALVMFLISRSSLHFSKPFIAQVL